MSTLRQKRVASLIKEELSRLLIEGFQSSSSGLITITRVEMSNDLNSAYVYLSFLGKEDQEDILELLEKKKGILRKSIASRVKLKYNPKLIFCLDKTLEYEERIDALIKTAKKK